MIPKYYSQSFGPISAIYYAMDLYEFIALDLNKKADTVWDYATYLTYRPCSTGRVSLYALEDFYIEVYYNQDHNCIEDIRSFKCANCLDPYLYFMDLDDLFD
jgi:hypothetical protein